MTDLEKPETPERAAWNPDLDTGERRMEVLEERLLEGPTPYKRGAVEIFDLTDPVERAISVKWHNAGWAKCLDTGSQVERKPGVVVLQPDPVVTEQSPT